MQGENIKSRNKIVYALQKTLNPVLKSFMHRENIKSRNKIVSALRKY